MVPRHESGEMWGEGGYTSILAINRQKVGNNSVGKSETIINKLSSAENPLNIQWSKIGKMKKCFWEWTLICNGSKMHFEKPYGLHLVSQSRFQALLAYLTYPVPDAKLLVGQLRRALLCRTNGIEPIFLSESANLQPSIRLIITLAWFKTGFPTFIQPEKKTAECYLQCQMAQFLSYLSNAPKQRDGYFK